MQDSIKKLNGEIDGLDIVVSAAENIVDSGDEGIAEAEPGNVNLPIDVEYKFRVVFILIPVEKCNDSKE